MGQCHGWAVSSGSARPCGQTREAAIDIQRDHGCVSAWLCTEKPQLCEGLMEGVLTEEKHPRGSGEPRLPSSILRACVCSQRHCDCQLGLTAEVGSAGAEYPEKTHFRCCWETMERKVPH